MKIKRCSFATFLNHALICKMQMRTAAVRWHWNHTPIESIFTLTVWIWNVPYVLILLRSTHCSHFRIEILKTTSCHFCTSKKQFLISLNKLQMLQYIHANYYIQISPTL